jgi:hypothetical protein
LVYFGFLSCINDSGTCDWCGREMDDNKGYTPVIEMGWGKIKRRPKAHESDYLAAYPNKLFTTVTKPDIYVSNKSKRPSKTYGRKRYCCSRKCALDVGENIAKDNSIYDSWYNREYEVK